MAFNVEITEKVEQPLMSRALLKGFVSFDAAPPSFAELRKQLASSVKADEALVVVQSLRSLFGTRKSEVAVHVYKSKAAVASFESKVIEARNKPRVKKAATATSDGK